jgi:uncharacterized MAPEG superfamily protein
MTSEMTYLSWILVLHLVIWIPYILNLIATRGLVDAVGYPENPPPMAAWAQRLKAAHYNAVENLVVFAALVLMANALGTSNATTVLACQVYFWARLAHLVLYTFGVPWGRTLAFAVAWVCQVVLLLQII